ncbi:MAG: sugar transferase [Ignavibacteriales bacterium]|nr:sugar transferase [Ignavibacteriales bacterium]
MKIPKYKIILAITDYFIIMSAFILSAFFAHVKMDQEFNWYNFILAYPQTFLLFLIFPFIYNFIQQSNGLYKLNNFLTIVQQSAALVKSLFYSFIALIIISFLIKFRFLLDSRLFVISVLSFTFLFSLIIRVLVLRKFYLLFAEKKILKRNILIIGAGKSGKLIATKFLFENNAGLNISGFVDDNIAIGEKVIKNLQILGGVNDLTTIVSHIKVDEVLIAIDNTSYDRLLEIVDVCNKLGLMVRLTSELFKIIPQKLITDAYYGIPLIESSPVIDPKVNYFYKRGIDIIGSLFGLILLSPLFLIIAIIIKINSKGPVLFKQTRIGKYGKPFMFYKFRSMTIVDNDDKEREKKMIEFMKENNSNGRKFSKVINQGRVTKIGKLIRKSSIDELPQLFSVLKGEMSLVGPRPCLPYEFDNYDEWQKRRLSAVPGCTGVWQVSGRSEVTFNDSVVLDIYYINNMTPWLDLQIILKTLPVMFFAKGGK